MDIIQQAGSCKSKATHALATVGPGDGRQIGLDNSVIASMATLVGSTRSRGAATVIRN